MLKVMLRTNLGGLGHVLDIKFPVGVYNRLKKISTKEKKTIVQVINDAVDLEIGKQLTRGVYMKLIADESGAELNSIIRYLVYKYLNSK